ncbi:MAG: hypothetical protein LBI55_04085 [Oscillospiraceae bacterium]|jgi:hypothetical protein|nr:hypothetical protein [Oscillospiraceae bacterium]
MKKEYKKVLTGVCATSLFFLTTNNSRANVFAAPRLLTAQIAQPNSADDRIEEAVQPNLAEDQSEEEVQQENTASDEAQQENLSDDDDEWQIEEEDGLSIMQINNSTSTDNLPPDPLLLMTNNTSSIEDPTLSQIALDIRSGQMFNIYYSLQDLRNMNEGTNNYSLLFFPISPFI